MQAADARFHQSILVSRDALYHQLQHCFRRKDLAAGRKAHSSIVHMGLDTVPVLLHHLLRFYVACGSLSEAVQLFEASKPDLFSFNAIMSAHAKLGDASKTFELFESLETTTLTPDTCTFLSVLNACGKLAAACQCRLIHDRIIRKGLDIYIIMSNTIIDVYGKCACFNEGSKVFDLSCNRNVVTWAAIIAGYSLHNQAEIVLKLYSSMKLTDLKPNDAIFSCVLKSVGKLGLLHAGRFVHEDVIRAGLEDIEVISTALIDMYAKCKNLEDAWTVFQPMTSLNVVMWNTIIMAYTENGDNCLPIVLFKKMLQNSVKPDKVSYLGVLRACANKQELEQGRALHNFLVQSSVSIDLALNNSLMNMYAKCDRMVDAQRIFESLSNPDISSWGPIIDGYVEHGNGCAALRVFQSMQDHGVKPNDFTFVSSLKACINNGSIKYCYNLHNQVVKAAFESNTLVGSTIVDMYAKLGSLEEASNCFERIEDPDVVAWGAMICGCMHRGHENMALQMFMQMLLNGIDANEGIYVPILQACVSFNTVEFGRLLHEYIIKRGVQTNGAIGTSLVHLYADFGLLKDAKMVFEAHSSKEVAAWGAMIGGCVQYADYPFAIDIFGKMYSHNIEPNHVIFLFILKTCGSLGSLGHGRLVHKEIIETGLEADIMVANILVDMYIKCGSKHDAQCVLYKLSKRDVISWSVLLAGHAQHGDLMLSWKCLDAMRQEGLQPDDAVMTNVLAACSHEGSLEKGLVCFNDMPEQYQIAPGFQHYYAVADLLVRVGMFVEAEALLFSLPKSENIVGWTSLLTGCSTYGIVQLGNKCFGAVTEMVPSNALPLMPMSNFGNHPVGCDMQDLSQSSNG